MRRFILLAACAALALSTSAIFASGSSGAAIPAGGGSSERPFAVTTHLKCTVIEVHENNLIKVKDHASGEVHMMQLTTRIPIKAQDKSQFDGRKKLQPEDLKEGHRILVTKRTDANVVVRIKVLKNQDKA
jgi:hypothetical protein